MRVTEAGAVRTIMVMMVDSTDHVTGKTGLTLTILASKAGGDFGAISPSVVDKGYGWYSIALTASHTDTYGDLVLHITGTGADPCDLCIQIVGYEPENYNNLGMSDLADTLDFVEHLPGDPASATNVSDAVTSLQFYQFVRAYTCADAGTTDTIVLDGGASTDDDYYNGCFIGTRNPIGGNDWQVRRIIDYDGTTQTCLVEPDFGYAPASGDQFVIWPDAALKLAPGSITVVEAPNLDGKISDVSTAISNLTTDVGDVETAVGNVATDAAFLRRCLTNKRVWDAANSRWAIYNDAGDTIIYYLHVTTPAGGPVTLDAAAIANGDKIA